MNLIPEQTTTKPTSIVDSLFRGAMTPPKGSTHDQLVEQTEKWVASSFYGELLKQVRNSPFKSDLFSGGRGGEAFGSMQDQQMAEHMTRGAGRKLVNAIVRRIEAAAAYQNQKRGEARRAVDAHEQSNGPRRVEASASASSGTSSPTVRAAADVAPLR